MLRAKVTAVPILALPALIILGCVEDDPLQPSRLTSADLIAPIDRIRQIAEEAIERSIQGDLSRGIENDILRMEADVASIGGMYFDPETQRMVVIVTKESDRRAAVAAARRHYVGRLVGTLLDELGLLLPIGRSVDVRLGDYSFSSLVAWHEILIADLFTSVPETISIDADERANRVEIIVEDISVRPQIQAILEANAVPLNAVVIREGPRPRIAAAWGSDNPTSGTGLDASRSHSLQSPQRIMGAGLEIYNASAGGTCTQGFTAESNGTWGYFTAAHCGPPIGSGSTGAEFYQPNRYNWRNDAWNFGWVWRNPRFNHDPPCESDRGYESDLCTTADALYLATNPAHRQNSPEPGNLLGELRVAWTTVLGINNQPGSVQIDRWYGIWRGTPAYSVGSSATKTGSKTGTTRGTISNTHTSISYCSGSPPGGCRPYAIVLGAVRVNNASAGRGDSGGPVFSLWQWYGEVNAMPFGILFAFTAGSEDSAGRCTANCTFLFSPLHRVRAHLGRPFNLSDNDWPGWD